MIHLIGKDALVAEIDNILDYVDEHWDTDYAIGAKRFADKLQDAINTLEVKEVDFGTEVYKYIDEHFNVYDDGNQTLQTKDKKSLIGRVDVENIAKHFFELGLKAQKGE